MIPLVDWHNISIADGEQVIRDFSKTIEEGSKILRDRAVAAAKANLFCSNPRCMKPLRDERSAVSSWTVHDRTTGIDRTFYSCSQRCHMIIHNFQQGERCIKT